MANMVEIRKKKVDEEWKAQAEAQKQQEAPDSQGAQDEEEMVPGFPYLLSIFASQAMIQLGEIEHPLAKQRILDLKGAKFSIDMLSVVKEKTKGNLSQEEEQQLDNLVFQLKMHYVRRAGIM